MGLTSISEKINTGDHLITPRRLNKDIFLSTNGKVLEMNYVKANIYY